MRQKLKLPNERGVFVESSGDAVDYLNRTKI